MRSVPGVSPRARAFVAWALGRGKLLWTIALLVAIPATWRTAMLYAHLQSDLEVLLPRDAASVRAIDELRKRMSGLQYLGVIVDAGDAKRTEDARRFIDDLAARMRTYPPEMLRSVRTGDEAERAFLEHNIALYTDVGDLRTIATRLEVRRDYEVSKEMGTLLDPDAPPPPVDLSDIEAKYRARLPAQGQTEGGHYASSKLHVAMLLAEVGEFSSGVDAGHALLDRVQAEIRALGGTDRYAPGMRLGFSGDVAISVEELSALVTDLSISTVLVVVAVIAVIILYFRWWRSIAVLLPPLLLATVYSFALASLPPFRVTALNSNTAFLGSIIVGNGINFGIMLLARYVEERRRLAGVVDALGTAVGSARAGTLPAALAASVSYAALSLTQFQGFRQFGVIGGIGMVLSWGLSFLLMPSLIAWLDDSPQSAPKPVVEDHHILGAIARLVVGHRYVVAVAGAGLTLLSLAQVSRLGPGTLEHDFSKLRRSDTWTRGEGYWGGKMDELLGTYLTPTVLLTNSNAEARALANKLRAAVKEPPLAERVASVRTLDDVLPGEQAAKLEQFERIREVLTPDIRKLLTDEQRAALDRSVPAGSLHPVTERDLPRAFTVALRERDGSMGKAVLVYPRPSKALWERAPLADFVRRLRSFDADAQVAGSLPLSADILASVAHDGPLATGAAFLGVVVVIALLLRKTRLTGHVLGALVVGVLWLTAATAALGVKINFANFIAFPITFGIGADYAVNLVSRYAQEGRRDVVTAVRATGSAVALCSMTTIIGYSSLLVAENRALFLFGVVAVLGELACLTAALTFLPAVLAIHDGAASRQHLRTSE